MGVSERCRRGSRESGGFLRASKRVSGMFQRSFRIFKCCQWDPEGISGRLMNNLRVFKLVSQVFGGVLRRFRVSSHIMDLSS